MRFRYHTSFILKSLPPDAAPSSAVASRTGAVEAELAVGLFWVFGAEFLSTTFSEWEQSLKKKQEDFYTPSGKAHGQQSAVHTSPFTPDRLQLFTKNRSSSSVGSTPWTPPVKVTSDC